MAGFKRCDSRLLRSHTRLRCAKYGRRITIFGTEILPPDQCLLHSGKVLGEGNDEKRLTECGAFPHALTQADS